MPGASQPEQPAVTTPEQARLPRGVEVRPTPIPKFDGENASGVQDAFAENLNLVSGGNVTTADGQTIQTPGILGSAQDKIAARLEEINATGQALAGEKEQFGGKLKGLRGPRAVREAEREKRQQSRADNQDSAKARNQVRAQEGRIRGLCAKEHISETSQTRYSHLVTVEEFLNAHPDTDNLESALESADDETKESFQALNLAGLSRQTIKERLAGVPIYAQGYEEYKPLEIGRRKFEADLKTTEAKRSSNAEAMKAKLQEARDKATDWEQRNAQFKREDTPEQRRLKEDHALGEAVSKFLGDSYVPDAARLAQVGEDLSAANDKLSQGETALASVAKLPIGGRIAKWLLDIAAPRILLELRQRADELHKESYLLVNPAARLLTQPGAPKALTDMVRKVYARDFDMAKVPPREKVLAETVTALLGKGVVTVEDSSKEESATAGEAPEIAGPAADGDGTPVDTTADVVIPEPELSPPPTPDQLADMAMDGKLTLQQIRELPEDPEIQGINNTLADPNSVDTMKADLQASLQEAAAGRPGIRSSDLPLLVIYALRDIAPYLGGYPPETVVSLNDFRTHLDKLPEPSNPEDQVNLAAAKRLLAVAETANKLRKS